ncbi:MAG: flagellar basal body-associated FliL family protein [Pseudomonadota bacterium]
MNKKTLIFSLLGVVLLAGTVAGTLLLAKTYLMPPAAPANAAEHAAVPAAIAEATYKTIDPPFVVNIQDGARFRFLQVEVDVMTRNATAFARLDKAMPRVKSELNMLFGSLQRENVQTVEGQKALQAQALALINSILKEETGSDGIAAVYFTKFVVQ